MVISQPNTNRELTLKACVSIYKDKCEKQRKDGLHFLCPCTLSCLNILKMPNVCHGWVWAIEYTVFTVYKSLNHIYEHVRVKKNFIIWSVHLKQTNLLKTVKMHFDVTDTRLHLNYS